MLLVIRIRALSTRRRQAEDALMQELNETARKLRSAQADLLKYTQELDGTIRDAEETAEESTKAVLKGAAHFLQSLAVEQRALLDGLQRKYGGHAVLGDLMEVTHANAQMARKAQGIAVLCGAPVGRRTRSANVYNVVRSAQGQIRNFRRVEIMQQTGFALKASAVSPVALAVAELLDNAASFSQHDAPIEVTFQRAQSSLCIVIDDAGVGMIDEERQNASALLSGDFVPRLSQLGNQPKFGFPVIGLLARHYGFRVDVTGISRYGGVRAVVLLPEELWTEEQPPAMAEGARVSSVQGGDGSAPAVARTAHGLPKRGARQVPVTSVSGIQDFPPQSRTPENADLASGRSLGALQRGTLSARDLDSVEGLEDT
ncbi:ATP-binding protein [Streptomyces spiralis]|uniref:ATP-binding protein n=1 Tax=Streptomyces spiralis TaxID=66376 RepID=UPI0036B79825